MHIRSIIPTLLATALCGLTLLGQAQPAKPASVEGAWQGEVSNGMQVVRFVIHIVKQGEDYTGDYQIPERSPDSLPLSLLSYKDGALKFSFTAFAIKWEGKLNEAGTQLVGRASDGAAIYPMNFSRATGDAAAVRPQNPVPPFPYTVQEIQFLNGPARVILAGTLTLPQTKGPFPGVILLIGAGQTDRDGAAYGHKPFLVMADYLTRRGIAVLRLNDRGVGNSEGSALGATLADFTGDIAAGASYLKARKDIGAVTAIGYGIGGAAAAAASTKAQDISQVVLLGVPALDGKRVLTAQAEAIARAGGAAPEELRMILRFQARAIGIVATIKNAEDASGALVAAMTDEVSKLPEGRRAAWLTVMSTMMRKYDTPWMRFFAGLDPGPIFKSTKCPVLALYGDKDIEVDPAANSSAMAFLLKSGGTADFKIETIPGLNHLFQTSASSDYEKVSETVAPALLKRIGDWIDSHSQASH